jgi:PKD repeat protein
MRLATLVVVGGALPRAPARALVALVGAGLVLMGGCPPADQGDGSSPVTARISASILTGPAPLGVSFSGSGSTSANAGDLRYQWDFGNGNGATGVNVTHTFTAPGRYTVILIVTDAANEEGRASVDVRAAGGPINAVISASVTSGVAPLGVQFDASQSQVLDDQILNYSWDFGDGGTSNQPDPLHMFNFVGSFNVRLTIETAGGVTDSDTITITVGARNGSLQFGGTNLATLPLTAAQLNAATLEAWVRPEAEGGTVASVANGAMTLEVLPSTNTIRAQVNGVAITASATGMSGAWRHVALVFEPGAGTATIFLDGAPLASGNVTGTLSVSSIVVGNGYRGRVAEVRFWNVARPDTAIQSNYNRRLTGTPTGLIGYWPMNEGTGQTLANRAVSANAGRLGTTAAQETSDPAWSTDGPAAGVVRKPSAISLQPSAGEEACATALEQCVAGATRRCLVEGGKVAFHAGAARTKG